MRFSNVGLCRALVEKLSRLGVREYVICPGSRNSPLILTLDAAAVDVHTHFDERGAGFYALGRSYISQRPVAVVVTSGTAVSELYSAVIEAHYQRRSLILVCADRPVGYASTGAPQAIDQFEIFGKYAQCIQLNSLELVEQIKIDHGPIQINIPFDEPLIDGPIEKCKIDDSERTFTKKDRGNLEKPDFTDPRPLFIISGLDRVDHQKVIQQLAGIERPMWIEATSGILNHPQLSGSQLMASDRVLKILLQSGNISSVIRVGDVPTCRAWRDLENNSIPVFSFTNKGWSGLSRPSFVFDLAQFYQVDFSCVESLPSEIAAIDHDISERVSKLIFQYPRCEAAFVSKLASNHRESSIYLGNSLPIRHWDNYSRSHRNEWVWGNRGVNGIDGQIASFFGSCELSRKNFALIGDLTAMYDMNSLCLAPERNWQIAVINNGGGKIFKHLYEQPIFQNPHKYKLSQLSEFFGIPMRTIASTDELNGKFEYGLLELSICQDDESRFNNELDKIYKAIEL